MSKAKKALILHGDNNIGKTTTLYELIKLFPKDMIEMVKEHNLYKNSKREYPEASALVKYKEKTIWIITRGDNLDCVLKEIEEFNKKGHKIEDCDLFICASHNGGKLVKYILETFDIKKFILKEDVDMGREQFCKEKAKLLLTEIDKFL